MGCPVLSKRMLLPGRAGPRGVAGGPVCAYAIGLRAPYVMSGTDEAYAALRATALWYAAMVRGVLS
eukprot:1744577-Rhodomonas_salina.3